eukprot:TRINITY_DN4297_c0_g1::TRINITY_DN4297_c0_g1_i1::g.7943::m.7943 TRINITY_DN4297_c0_g1::TRINITY_DN4297_c0_g1_i1::g.7943  ORF type:complete len:661 (-),score=124.27,sp/Q9P7P0/YOL4_SCHPO/33.22/2e-84,Acyltransferase/PF01553.16/3.5e-14 TRINITY_DN4297_c0_g1_i1:59-2041(-)
MSLYTSLRFLFHYVLRLNFRRVTVIGSDNIPKDGPVILTGNHANQFIDSLLLVSEVDRPVSFLIAMKSLRRPVIGHLASALNAIGVERPQDLEPALIAGTISGENHTTRISGTATSFMKEVKAGDQLVIKSPTGGKDLKVTVKAVSSDTELEVSAPLVFDFSNVSAKVIPKVDQTGVFEEVYRRLNENKCIGIFPEGGSHDRTDFLPLKAGVALMALGAMEKYGCDVKIVPCGLTYFAGNRFRSDVIVDFGKAFSVRKELLDAYKAGDKRTPVAELLKEVEARMRETLITTPSYEELQMVKIMRRLYQPSNVKLHPMHYLKLNQRIAHLYSQIRADSTGKFEPMMRRIQIYIDELKKASLRDYQVGPEIDVGWASILLLERVGYLMLLLIPAIPGAILGAPIALFANQQAEKERKKALAASTVKISARDVVASYRLMVAVMLTPPVYFVYALMVWAWLILTWGVATGWALVLQFCTFLGIVTVVTPALMIATVHCGEEAFAVWKSLWPLFMSLIPSLRNLRKKLFIFRQEVCHEVRDAIHETADKLGPEWAKERIISPEAIRLEEEAGPGYEAYSMLGPAVHRRDSSTMFTVRPKSQGKLSDLFSLVRIPRLCATITFLCMLYYYYAQISHFFIYIFTIDETDLAHLQRLKARYEEQINA